jgi:hypothetical protein
VVPPRGSRRPAIAALCFALVACAPEPPAVDGLPIPVDLSTGAMTLQVRLGDDQPPLPAVVDTLAPLTVIDDLGLAEPRRRQVDLTVLDATGVPRVRVPRLIALDLHPCGAAETCQVGLDAVQPVRAMVGADALSRGAVRFEIGAGTVRLFPDISGSNEARTRACDGVFEAPFFGGGTLLVGGAEVTYEGQRIAVGACFDFDGTAHAAAGRGVDSLLLVSTGTAISVLSESAYARYRNHAVDAPPPGSLPTATLQLPSGPLAGRRATVSSIALLGEGSDERGPCTELYANHLMSRGGCDQDEDVLRCPCRDASFCRTAAAVELDRPLEVLVVPDESRLLQALRTELRPALPEIDGILAASALADLRLDVDYPHDRLLWRCTDPATCRVRPAVLRRSALPDITRCLDQEHPGPSSLPLPHPYPPPPGEGADP